MKANHNDEARRITGGQAVFNMSKIQIWKRITTGEWERSTYRQLYLICQRYKFESESQLLFYFSVIFRAVFNMSKIQIWKRITTYFNVFGRWVWLYLICQRYKFESESQLVFECVVISPAVFNMSKIQIWKRITTCCKTQNAIERLYLICQRYKFESESQLTTGCPLHVSSCI